jgi:hypothetical protein
VCYSISRFLLISLAVFSLTSLFIAGKAMEKENSTQSDLFVIIPALEPEPEQFLRVFLCAGPYNGKEALIVKYASWPSLGIQASGLMPAVSWGQALDLFEVAWDAHNFYYGYIENKRVIIPDIWLSPEDIDQLLEVHVCEEARLSDAVSQRKLTACLTRLRDRFFQSRTSPEIKERQRILALIAQLVLKWLKAGHKKESEIVLAYLAKPGFEELICLTYDFLVDTVSLEKEFYRQSGARDRYNFEELNALVKSMWLPSIITRVKKLMLDLGKREQAAQFPDLYLQLLPRDLRTELAYFLAGDSFGTTAGSGF